MGNAIGIALFQIFSIKSFLVKELYLLCFTVYNLNESWTDNIRSRP